MDEGHPASGMPGARPRAVAPVDAKEDDEDDHCCGRSPVDVGRHGASHGSANRRSASRRSGGARSRNVGRDRPAGRLRLRRVAPRTGQDPPDLRHLRRERDRHGGGLEILDSGLGPGPGRQALGEYLPARLRGGSLPEVREHLDLLPGAVPPRGQVLHPDAAALPAWQVPQLRLPLGKVPGRHPPGLGRRSLTGQRPECGLTAASPPDVALAR
jgi:hypothetical protein